MQVLVRIQSTSHLRKPMQKLLREKTFNNRHMTVERLKADGVLTLLREFGKQESITRQTFQKKSNSPITTITPFRQETKKLQKEQ